MRTSTSRLARVGALCSAALLSACVTVPTGPSVMVLPGTNKSFDQFQADGYACSQYAQQMTGNAGQAAADFTTWTPRLKKPTVGFTTNGARKREGSKARNPERGSPM